MNECRFQLAMKCISCIVVDDSAADETSENNTDVGDVDNVADKDGILPGTALLSKLHIVTNKVTLPVINNSYTDKIASLQ